MKKIYLAVVLLSSTTFNACTEKNMAQYEVINNSESKIDSFYVEPNYKPAAEKYVDIAAGKTIKYTADMTAVGKTDGLYSVHFILNQKHFYYDFGRYTKGQHLAEKIRITIEKDTVFYKIFPKDFL